jgi:D-alanine-D-alanine ligase
MANGNIKQLVNCGRVAVLLGGTSSEREISLLSGEAIFQSLVNQKIDVVKIDTQRDIYSQLKEKRVSRAFIALHGRDGEDGVIQGFLKLIGIPFTGSDTASSALAMNKLLTKQIWLQQGLDTAEFFVVKRRQTLNEEILQQIVDSVGFPVFVKPIREGSSVGMSKAVDRKTLVDAIELAQEYDDVLVEQFINGTEYTVSILDGKALPSISMQTPNEFYDYDAKYCANTTEYFCPSGLTEELETELADIAINAFDAIGCSGWGRVDFIRDESSGRFKLLEVNTVPGMTANSLVPKSAKAVGIGFDDLVKGILLTSFNEQGQSANGASHG